MLLTQLDKFMGGFGSKKQTVGHSDKWCKS